MLAIIRDKPEQVGLTLNVLVALNTYYRKRGLGLQQLPILETRGVLEPLMDSSRVLFMHRLGVSRGLEGDDGVRQHLRASSLWKRARLKRWARMHGRFAIRA